MIPGQSFLDSEQQRALLVSRLKACRALSEGGACSAALEAFPTLEQDVGALASEDAAASNALLGQAASWREQVRARARRAPHICGTLPPEGQQL